VISLYYVKGAAIPYLKTDNGEREIDLPENMAKLLVEFIGDRKSGLLLRTSNGKPVQHSSPPSPPRVSRHFRTAPTKQARSQERRSDSWCGSKERATEAMKPMVSGLLETDFRKSYEAIRYDGAFRQDVV
jgi:hypothetical protein